MSPDETWHKDVGELHTQEEQEILTTISVKLLETWAVSERWLTPKNIAMAATNRLTTTSMTKPDELAFKDELMIESDKWFEQLSADG